MDAASIGANLAFLRRWRNYTQEQVAEAIGVSRIMYAFYETGRNAPSLELIDQIAQLYMIPMDLITTQDITQCRFSPYELYDIDTLEHQLTKYHRLSLFSRCLVIERMKTLVEIESSLYGDDN